MSTAYSRRPEWVAATRAFLISVRHRTGQRPAALRQGGRGLWRHPSWVAPVLKAVAGDCADAAEPDLSALVVLRTPACRGGSTAWSSTRRTRGRGRRGWPSWVASVSADNAARGSTKAVGRVAQQVPVLTCTGDLHGRLHEGALPCLFTLRVQPQRAGFEEGGSLTMAARDHAQMDLLDTGAPGTGRPWPRWVPLAVACLVVVAATSGGRSFLQSALA